MNESNNNISFQGNLYEVRLTIYEKLMSPLAQLKKIFESIYFSLLNIIWIELMMGKKVESEVTNLVLFVIFCLLSLLSYYFQNYVEIIVILLAIFWSLDYFWAKNKYVSLKPHSKVFLKGNELITYKLKFSNHEIREFTIDLRQIKYLNLKQREIEQGAFQEIVGTIWQMSLIADDGSIYLIHETKDLHTILESAQKLKTQLNIPLIFADSQGNNDYANFPLQSFTWVKPNNIKCHKNQQKWHIYSQWDFHNFWHWLQQIFSESGFFFFVLIMSAFMIKFGSWVEFFLRSFLGIDFPVLRFYTPQELFSPEIGLTDWIELTIGIGLMINQGWKISRNKHIYINNYFCKFLVGNKQIAQFATKKIESILLLTKPESEILIFDDKKYLKLEEFQQQEELQEMLYQLELALNNFRAI